MNNPENQPIDVEDQRAWLLDHKKQTGMSWTEIGKAVGRASGTLSQFGSVKGYAGDEQELAEQVYRYQQQRAAQAAIALTMPDTPSYFAGPTSKGIITLLTYCQRGRMGALATGAGCGKTTTIDHYQACNSNVWKATMRPSTSGIMNMQLAVLAALGNRDAVGTPAKLSGMIMEKVQGTGGLLIFDDAQHLTEKSLEEIRSWHDETGIGITLAGNLPLMSRLEGGSRRDDRAQLFSRIGLRIIQMLPLTGDADALCDAWDIGDQAIITAVRDICGKPGGLRSATRTLELAHMMAWGEQQKLTSGHVRDCWAQLSTRQIAA